MMALQLVEAGLENSLVGSDERQQLSAAGGAAGMPSNITWFPAQDIANTPLHANIRLKYPRVLSPPFIQIQ
jgi:hypothetical protein